MGCGCDRRVNRSARLRVASKRVAFIPRINRVQRVVNRRLHDSQRANPARLRPAITKAWTAIVCQ